MHNGLWRLVSSTVTDRRRMRSSNLTVPLKFSSDLLLLRRCHLIVFEHKIGYNSANTRDGAENHAPNRRFVNCEVTQFNGVIEINSRSTLYCRGNENFGFFTYN